MSDLSLTCRVALCKFNSRDQWLTVRHKNTADALVKRGFCWRKFPGSVMLQLTEAGVEWLLDRGVKIE